MKTINTFLGPMRLATNYILADLNRRPKNYLIGIFAVFVVACFTSLLGAVSQITSLFLINISENAVGDYDFMMYPNYDSLHLENYSAFLNYTDIREKLSNVSSIRGLSPRLYSSMTVMNHENHSIQANAFGIFEDSRIENEIGLGRRQDFEVLEKNEVLVTQSLIDTLKPKDGRLRIKLSIFQSLTELMCKLYPEKRDWVIRAELDPKNLANTILKPWKSALVSYFSNTTHVKVKDLRTKLDSTLMLTGFGAILGSGKINVVASFLGVNITETIMSYHPQDAFVGPFFQKLLLDLVDMITIGDITDLLLAAKRGLTHFREDDELDIYQIFYDGLYEILKASIIDMELEVKVKQVVVTPKGKWPNVNGHAIAIDYQYIPYYFVQSVKNFLEKSHPIPHTYVPDYSSASSPITSRSRALASHTPVLDAVFESGKITDVMERKLSSFNHYDYSLLLTVILNNKLYIYKDDQTIFQKLSLITDSIYRALEMENLAHISLNLYDSILQIKNIPTITDTIFLAINFLLNLLCAVLIYSLLNTDIQEKSFEFGTLRSLGLDRRGILSLMIVRATIILIPGLIIGNLVSYVMYTMVCFIVHEALHLAGSYSPPFSVFILSVIWSIFLVVLASAAPIMRVLSRSLAQSLNFMQRSINEIVVVIKRLDEIGMSSSQVIGSLMLSVFGFSMYYLAPSAYLTKDFSYFLNTMASLLLLSIFASIVMLGFLQGIMQSGILFVLQTFWKELRLTAKVIKKNFISHKAQNFRTANMIGVAFGFMIFGIASFDNLGNIFTAFLKSYNTGSDLSIISSPKDGFQLPEKALREFFRKYADEYPDHIANYTMVSNMLGSTGSSFGRSTVKHMNGQHEVQFHGWGVEPNFLGSTFAEYYRPGPMDSSVKYSQISEAFPFENPIDALYSDEGLESHKGWDSESVTTGLYSEISKEELENISKLKSRFIKLMISPDLIKKAGLELGSTGRLTVGGINHWWFQVRAIPNNFPWFRFTANRILPDDHPVALLSMEDLRRIERELYQLKYGRLPNEAEELENWSYGVHKKLLFVKFAKELSDADVQSLRNRLLEIIKSDTPKLMVTKDFVRESKNALFFFTIFTAIIGLLGLFLAFFVSWNAAWTNIRSNEVDIGILRAVGVTQNQVKQMSVVENLCVAAIGSFNGALIGILACVGFTLEASIFTGTPLDIHFPAIEIVGMFIITFGLTLLASKLAINSIFHRQITQSFKKEIDTVAATSEASNLLERRTFLLKSM